MPLTLQQQLGELEDQLILGEILDSDYKQRKWAIIKQFRERGEIVRATGQVKLTEVVDSCGKIFCPVPPGPFVYGPNNEYGETKATYYCSKYPVTVKEFLEFLDDSGWPYGEEDIEALLLVSQDEDCPASHLSFNDAKGYCRWLRRKTQEYYALPLEIEWEKAARGEDGRYFPWGNEEPTPEWACYLPEDAENNGTVPVGSLEKNSSPYGCAGMVGNVWEWCLDSVDDPRDPHILRGGSWCNAIDYTNCLARTYSFPPDKRIDYGGIRLLYLTEEMVHEYRKAYDDDDGTTGNANLTVIRFSGKQADAAAATVSEKQSGLAAALDSAVKEAAKDQPKPSSKESVGGETTVFLDGQMVEMEKARVKAPIVAPIARPTARVSDAPEMETPASKEAPEDDGPAEKLIMSSAANDLLADAIGKAGEDFLRKKRDQGIKPKSIKRGEQLEGSGTGTNLSSQTGLKPVPGRKKKAESELEFLDPETKEVMVETPVLNKDQDVDPLDELASTGGDVITADNTPLTYAAFAVWCLLLLSLIGLAWWKYFT